MIRDLKPGEKFGAWTVIEQVGFRKDRKYECVCDCGVKRAISKYALLSWRRVQCKRCFLRTFNSTICKKNTH